MKFTYFYKYFIYRHHTHVLKKTVSEVNKMMKLNSYDELFPEFFIDKNEFYLKNIYMGASNNSFRYLFGLPINGQRT